MSRIAWATWFAAAALGQPGLVPGLPGLKRIEAGLGDAGPLSVSQRLVPLDLRQPIGFEGVYQFERPAGWGRMETMYVRMNGGVAAVFPRSVYVPTKGGLVPEIPAGTVFSIGTPKFQTPAPPKPASASAVDLKYRPEDRTVSPAVSRAVASPTIWTSERFRQARVQTLLERALERP